LNVVKGAPPKDDLDSSGSDEDDLGNDRDDLEDKKT